MVTWSKEKNEKFDTIARLAEVAANIDRIFPDAKTPMNQNATAQARKAIVDRLVQAMHAFNNADQ